MREQQQFCLTENAQQGQVEAIMSNFYSKDKNSWCKLWHLTQISPLPSPAELVFLQGESN